MESPEGSYVSSPEHQQKRSAPPMSPVSDGTERPTYVKFLVSNSEAGSVIGKGGTTITDFQSQSGARIQLSRNQEFFPGTNDRIIMVSGTIDEVLKGVRLILSKLSSEISEDADGQDPRTRVRLVVPNMSCGALIGKGGTTIKSFIEDSQAVIKISPQDNTYYGNSDRLVTVSGSLEEEMRAVDLILSKLTEDPYYVQSMNSPFPYPATSNTMSYGPNGANGKFESNKDDRGNSVTIDVADEHIGVVVGRGGRNIVEINQISGARIKISDRGDFMPGTTNRKVTITGSRRQIKTAEALIMHKVTSVADR